MAYHAVGGLTGEFDGLLVDDGGVAHHRLGITLLAQLAQQAGGLFFVGVRKQHVTRRLFGLEHRGRKVELVLVGGHVGPDLQAQGLRGLEELVAAAFAEVVVDVDDIHRLGLELLLDVARHLGHRRRLGEVGAEDIGIALLRDGGGGGTGEVGDLGAPGLVHAHGDGAREDRADHGIGVHVHCLLRQGLGHARVGLGVEGGQLDLAAQNAAGGIDFFHRQLGAVFQVGADRGASARQLQQIDDLDRLGGHGSSPWQSNRERQGQRACVAEQARGGRQRRTGHVCLLQVNEQCCQFAGIMYQLDLYSNFGSYPDQMPSRLRLPAPRIPSHSRLEPMYALLP